MEVNRCVRRGKVDDKGGEMGKEMEGELGWRGEWVRCVERE